MQARYAQIKQDLRHKIETGELVAGQQVPSEHQLCALFSVSRMTARRALSDLVDEGILMRSQGTGTFVADARPMSSMLTIRSISDEIKQRGHDYHSHVITLETRRANAQQAAWLSLEEGSNIYMSLVLHLENNLPVQWEQRFVNPHMAPAFIQQNFNETTANLYLSKVAPLTEADHVVEAVLPNEEQARWLQITPQQPCLQIGRRTFSSGGVVSYALLLHPGNRYRLGGHLAFQP